MIMTSELEDIVRQAISNNLRTIAIDRGEQSSVFNYIGWLLSIKGMVHWQIKDEDKLVVGFRPFNYELDTSLLATMHH